MDNKNHRLKIFYKTAGGAGLELAVLEGKSHVESITQWLLIKRDVGKTSFFLALCDVDNTCIDAKYISDATVAKLLEDWGIPLLVD